MLFRKKGTKYNGVFCALNDCPVANNSTIESNYIPVDVVCEMTVSYRIPIFIDKYIFTFSFSQECYNE